MPLMAMLIVCETGAVSCGAYDRSIAGCNLTICVLCGSGAEHAAKISNVAAPQGAIFLMPYHTVRDGLC
jgi:hypothetical protein